MMKRLAVTLCVLAPAAAHAGGLFVPGTGPQAQARAGAFVAKADDPTALYHNPAGFAKIAGTVVYVGTNLVNYSLDFARAGRYEDTGNGEPYIGEDFPSVSNDASPALGVGGFQSVPLIAVGTDLGHPSWPVRFGVGLVAPQAYPNRSFGETVTIDGVGVAPAPQRYDIIEQEAVTAMPSVAVSYSPVDWIDVGVRGTWGVATLKATSSTWGIRNYEEWDQKDSLFQLDTRDNFVPAFGVGVLVRPSAAVELGFSYHSALAIRATGTGTAALGSAVDPLDPNAFIEPEDRPPFIDCALGGTVDALSSCIDLDLPQLATLGGRYILRDTDGRERGDVELDVRWENWSAKRASDYEIRVDGRSSTGGFVLNPVVLRHGGKDVISVRLGGAYRVRAAGRDLHLRGGIAYDTEAAPTDFARVDFDSAPRATFALGAGYELAGGRYRVDLGAGYVVEPSRTVAQCLPPDGPDVMNTACDGVDRPTKDRSRPDPAQPLGDTNSARESPFNAGAYDSGYLLLSLGVSASF